MFRTTKSVIPAFFTFALLICALVSNASAQFVEIPELSSPVVDHTGVLGSSANKLRQQLVELKAEKGSEVAVLIVPSTKPEAIEQYSIRVVEAWKLGRQGVDDGALLLIALQDRTVRIEVGRGLEGDLPDAIANRIIQEIIVPHFRKGDLAEGVQAGVDAISSVIRGVSLPPPKLSKETDLGALLPLFFFAYIVGAVIATALGLGIGASAGAFLGLGLGLLVAPLLIAIPFAIVCGVFILFSDPRSNMSHGGGPGYYRSGGRRGGGFSGGFGGGGFGGGGFGGGGTFSGGGASGRW